MVNMSHGIKIPGPLKSRARSIPVNVETLIRGHKLAAFQDELQKLSEGVSDIEAVEAAKTLTKRRPWKSISQTAALAGSAAPAIDVAGKFTKGFVNTKGSLGARAAGGAKEVATITKGDVAAKALTTGLGGGAISAAREGLTLSNAKKTLQAYVQQDKTAGVPGALMRTSTTTAAKAAPVAALKGTPRVTDAVVKPRRSISDAVKAFMP